MSQLSPQHSLAEVQQTYQHLMEAERHQSSGELEPAREICEKLLEHYPDYAGARVILATTYLQEANHAAAFPHLVRAAILNPNDPTILVNLGKAYLELDASECAVEILERALELHPDWPGAYYVMGEVWLTLGDHPRAVQFFEKSLSLNPDDPGTKIRVGSCLASMGRYEDAISAMKSALELPLSREQQCLVYYALSELPYLPGNIDVLEALNELRDSDPADTDSTASMIAFARGLTLDKLGRHKEAWECLVTANRKIAELIVTECDTYFTQAEMFLEKALNWQPSMPRKASLAENDGPVSLFILGPSRSGKTTLESLVASLEGITKGFEHNIVKNTTRRATQRAELLTEDRLANLPRDLDGLFAEHYHTGLLDIAGDARVFITTHPGAISDVGRIAETVSNARFIFVKRNMDDTAFRIFTYLYISTTNPYSYDINTIYKYLELHYRMADNWLEKLENKTLLISYEDMVQDPQATLKSAADLCGIVPPQLSGLEVADDRGCSDPYKKFLESARTN